MPSFLTQPDQDAEAGGPLLGATEEGIKLHFGHPLLVLMVADSLLIWLVSILLMKLTVALPTHLPLAAELITIITNMDI